MWLYYRIMRSKGADGMVNTVDRDQTAPLAAVWPGFTLLDPDQTAPLGAVWSGFTLFA